MVPLLFNEVDPFVCPSVIEPVAVVFDRLITGLSFCPVTVTDTVSVTMPPCPSSMARVNVSTAVCPLARYCADVLGRLYVQPTVPLSELGLSLTEPSVSVPPNEPVLPVTVTECVSIRSASVKAITPVLLNVGIEASSVNAPIASVRPTSMTATSLIPVTVTDTCLSTVPPWPSSIVTVNVSTAVFPLARYWAEVLGRL